MYKSLAKILLGAILFLFPLGGEASLGERSYTEFKLIDQVYRCRVGNAQYCNIVMKKYAKVVHAANNKLTECQNGDKKSCDQFLIFYSKISGIIDGTIGNDE